MRLLAEAQAPETGKGAKETGGGREAHNPVLQRLMARIPTRS